MSQGSPTEAFGPYLGYEELTPPLAAQPHLHPSSAPEIVRSSQTRHMTVVILVILAAALAATAVYFVLPLLT